MTTVTLSNPTGVQAKVNTATVAKTDTKGGRMPPPVRVPQLVLERVFPNANMIVTPAWASGMTAYGIHPRSWSIYKTTDGGKSWTRKSTADMTYALNKRGMFLKTAANTLLSVEEGTPTVPTVRRSTDDGVTWSAAVYTFRTNARGLCPDSWAQDPNTGRIYLCEYHVDNAKTTVLVLKSDDDGATWSTFYTFPAWADSTNPAKVRHIHSCQWDAVSARMYFCVGDTENKAGIYRVDAGGTTLEAVVTNDSNSQTSGGATDARAVGLMFFPTHIAWITDDTRSRLVRMARTEIGNTTPVITEVYQANACGWSTMQVASDGSAWLAFSDAETAASPLDQGSHVYYVTDNGATISEVGTVGGGGQEYNSLVPVGGALNHSVTNLWVATTAIFDNDQQNMFAARGLLAFGGGQPIAPLTHDRPDFTQPVTISSGVLTLAASGTQIFFEYPVPVNTTRVYIIDWGVQRLGGTGQAAVKVTRMDNSSVFLNQGNGNSDTAAVARSSGRQGDPYYSQASVPAGTKIRFEFRESGGSASVTGNAFVTIAFGI